METKECTKCHLTLPSSSFYACKHTKSGLQSWCKECTRAKSRETRQSNPDAVREYQRKYRIENSVAVKAAAKKRSRSHYLANREAILERLARYSKEHPELRKRIEQTYLSKNRDKRAARTRQYFLENPHIRNEQSSRRRARERHARIGNVDFNRIWHRDKGICHICEKQVNKKMVHYDHVVPLSRGGEHSMSNIRVSHSKCNVYKGVKLMSELNLDEFKSFYDSNGQDVTTPSVP